MGPGIICKLFPLVLFSFVFFLLVVSSENDVPTTDLQQPLPGNSLSVFAKGSDSAAEGNATEAASKRKRRSKRCKCSKRFTKEVSTMVEERLQEFENKYLLRLNRKEDTMTHDDAAAVAANEAASTLSQKIQNIDHMLLKLNADVLETKEALAFVVGNLDTVKHEFNHTTGNMLALNSSFKKLDKAVANLTRYVEKVQSMIPPGLAVPTSGTGLESATQEHYPRNCDEVVRQGGMQFQGDYYIMIKPDGITRPFRVLCQTLNNSGWTVIQKRKDGSVDFFRNWQEYKKGFGNLEGEFWLGNDYIHYLSVQEPTMLRIEMIDWDDKTYTALYDSFTIESEKNLYRLHIGSYHGDAGDSLKSHWENHDGMPFSTKDRDNDGRYYDSCAEHFHGAWWFNNCFDSHLNGKYYHKGFHKNYFQRDGIQWNTIHMYSSLKAVQMMVKPGVAPPPVSTAPPGDEASDVSDANQRKDRSRGRTRGANSGRRERTKA